MAENRNGDQFVACALAVIDGAIDMRPLKIQESLRTNYLTVKAPHLIL